MFYVPIKTFKTFQLQYRLRTAVFWFKGDGRSVLSGRSGLTVRACPRTQEPWRDNAFKGTRARYLCVRIMFTLIKWAGLYGESTVTDRKEDRWLTLWLRLSSPREKFSSALQREKCTITWATFNWPLKSLATTFVIDFSRQHWWIVAPQTLHCPKEYE